MSAGMFGRGPADAGPPQFEVALRQAIAKTCAPVIVPAMVLRKALDVCEAQAVLGVGDGTPAQVARDELGAALEEFDEGVANLAKLVLLVPKLSGELLEALPPELRSAIEAGFGKGGGMIAAATKFGPRPGQGVKAS